MLQDEQQQEKNEQRIDLPTFCRKLSQATDINSACILIEQQLKSMEYDLLSVKFCDTLDEKPAIRPFSRYPKPISDLSVALRDEGGCPISKEILIQLRPFDATAIDLANYSGFLEKRFLQELAKIDHLHIAVIPMIFGRGLSVYTVGLNDTRFVGRIRDELINFVSHANTALLCSFPETATLFEPKVLSLQEAQIVTLYGNGNSLSEIAATTGFSELTVHMILQHAAKKLDARSSAHLLTKALASGEILNMQSE